MVRNTTPPFFKAEIECVVEYAQYELVKTSVLVVEAGRLAATVPVTQGSVGGGPSKAGETAASVNKMKEARQAIELRISTPPD
jgi:hypothetical protein